MDNLIKRHKGTDWPPIYATIRDDDGLPVVLTGATITLEMRPVENTSWASSAGAIENEAQGVAKAVIPTTAVGVFLAYLKCVQSGKVYTAPDDGYWVIEVLDAHTT